MTIPVWNREMSECRCRLLVLTYDYTTFPADCPHEHVKSVAEHHLLSCAPCKSKSFKNEAGAIAYTWLGGTGEVGGGLERGRSVWLKRED